MNFIMIIRKNVINIIFYIRRIIPKPIHRRIGKKIKKKNYLTTLFSLSYGLIFLAYKKYHSRIVILKRDAFPSTINVVDISAVEAYREIMIENAYEKYHKIKSNDTVFDLGANIGIFSIKAAKRVGEKGKVIAVEPEPINIKLLKENTKYFNNVIIIPKAAGNTSGEIELTIGIHSGAHYINTIAENKSNNQKILIQIDTIDNLIKELGLEIIDFFKIDIEGWEYEALKGAVNSIQKIKFLVIASYHTKDGKMLVTEFLKNHNFKIINDGEMTYAWNKLLN